MRNCKHCNAIIPADDVTIGECNGTEQVLYCSADCQLIAEQATPSAPLFSPCKLCGSVEEPRDPVNSDMCIECTSGGRCAPAHTPAPWKAECGSVKTQAPFGEGKAIAHMVRDFATTGIRPVECDANARLIAAAPDLLEAIDQALYGLYCSNDANGRHNNRIKQCKQAIAKARGQ